MNRITLVTYKVKKDFVDENIRLIKSVMNKLKELKPKDFQYSSTLAEDGQTFTHIAWTKSEKMANYLPTLDEFKFFRAGLDDRCEVNPKLTYTTLVEGYVLFQE